MRVDPADGGCLACRSLLAVAPSVGRASQRRCPGGAASLLALRQAAAQSEARSAIDELTNIARGLAGKPELDATRRAILENALNYQTSVLQEQTHDPAVLYEKALIYECMGHIRAELGQRERADEAYRLEASLLDAPGPFPFRRAVPFRPGLVRFLDGPVRNAWWRQDPRLRFVQESRRALRSSSSPSPP